MLPAPRLLTQLLQGLRTFRIAPNYSKNVEAVRDILVIV
jgi:hypothetical protein